jgi:putative glutamine amidotransferase
MVSTEGEFDPASRPLIGVVADVQPKGGLPFHMAQDKYLRALWTASGALPMIVPSFGAELDLNDLVSRLDGLLLTGAVSNVEPHHYGASAEPPCGPYDPARDATTLPLIEAALNDGLPLLAICRGFQELNVALGGTLEPRLHEAPGRMDHRTRYDLPMAEQYAPVHSVVLAPGGVLAALLGEAETMVNSLHEQGIGRLAPGLVAEATAPDGTIEGVRVIDARDFALGIQWHPEWDVMNTPLSNALFRAFGDRARARMAARRRSGSMQPI